MPNSYPKILLSCLLPTTLLAQEVDLRSPDEFISVAGEIIGFNGVMLQVETFVGTVGVPASEVICYGPGCAAILASNDFGLTADALAGVVDQRFEDLRAAPPAAAAPSTRVVGFEGASFSTLYRTITGAYAVASTAANDVALSGNGNLTLSDGAGQSTQLLIANDETPADITVGSVALSGTAPVAYQGATEWVAADDPAMQMLGLKAFSVVVAPNAGITSITMEDLARVFAGEVTNWSQIGGADMNVLPLQLPANSELGTEVAHIVMEPTGRSVAANVLTMADQTGMAASILQFPGSIAVVESSVASDEITVAVAGNCGIPVMPTMFNVLSGDYPLLRPAMAQAAAGDPLSSALFDFAYSDIAQGLVAREGYRDSNAIKQEAGIKNARLSGLLSAELDDTQRAVAAQMFQNLFEAERLSTTFLGGPVSAAEAGWNRASMLDLVDTLATPEFAGREVIFVGVGQSSSGTAAAVAASQSAASDMAAAYRALAGADATVSSYGFGDAAMATCADGQVDGPTSTRVEVWLR